MTVRLATIVRWAVLAVILAIVFVPMYWILVTSFKTGRQILLSQNVYAPEPFTIENYLYLFEESRFALWFRNSAITATASTLLSLLIGTAGAYALTRLRFAGRRTLGAIVLVTYLVPPGLMFIPLYQTFIRIGYTDSLGTLILAYPTFLVPFVTWLLMGFFRSIPRQLEEAALVDGATRVQALVYVVLPLAAPGLLAAGLFCFTLSWNEFLYALIFIADDSLKTLPVGLSEFVVSDFAFWGQLMAAAALASLPVIVVYIYLHKYMVQGLTAGAVKG
ncbi:MAG TPA: carbohydrate ABC transporter permease [Methylomirabilota bacterium]|jgi:multiple sugar transport system permease protein